MAESNSVCDSALAGKQRRQSESGPVLDNPTKPTVGLGRDTNFDHFKSAEIQADTSLWGWGRAPSHSVYNTLGVSGQPHHRSLTLDDFWGCPLPSH